MSLGSSNQHQNGLYNDYTHTDVPPKVPEKIK